MASRPPAQQQTIHVHFNHQCPKCKAFYIPFDQKVPCPKCGLVETKRFDFITRAVESARFNLASYGTYTPGVWWVGSLGDFVLYLIFEILEQHRKAYYKQPIEEMADDILEATDLGDKPYLRSNVALAAIRVHQILSEEE